MYKEATNGQYSETDIQRITSYPISSILIPSAHLSLGLPGGLFISDVFHKNVHFPPLPCMLHSLPILTSW